MSVRLFDSLTAVNFNGLRAARVGSLVSQAPCGYGVPVGEPQGACDTSDRAGGTQSVPSHTSPAKLR